MDIQAIKKSTPAAIAIFAAVLLLCLLSGCTSLSSWFSPFGGDNPVRGQVDTASWQRFGGTIKPVQLDSIHYKMGRHFQEKKQYLTAIEEYKKVLSNYPGHIEALNAMGVAFDQLGRYDRAQKAYKAALDLDAERADVLNNLGYSYLMQGKARAAIDIFQKAVDRDRTNKTYSNNLGLAYARDRQYNKAFLQLRKACERGKAYQKLERIVARFGLLRVSDRQQMLANSDQKTKAFRKNKVSLPDDIPSDSLAQLRKLHKKILRYDQPRAARTSETHLTRINADRPGPSRSHFKTTSRNKGENNHSKSMAQAARVEIEVSNGNGVNGMARSVGEFLKERSFPVTRVNNARHFGFKRSTIYYCKGYITSAFDLARQIPGDQGIDEVEALGRPNIKLRLLLGRDLIKQRRFLCTGSCG